MDKELLRSYVDACALVEETEQDIQRLQRKMKGIVHDTVKGSTPDFPYIETHFKIEGIDYSTSDDLLLQQEEKLLRDRKQSANEIKLEVESYMNSVPVRIQRIIRYRLFERMSWEQTADEIGTGTGEGLRKELDRFLEEN